MSGVSGANEEVSGVSGANEQASEKSAAVQTSEQTSGPFLRNIAQKKPKHLQKGI